MPYGTFPPSERCVRLSPHTAQASQRPFDGPVSMRNMLAARYWTEVDSLTGKVAPVEQSHRHLQHPLYRFPRCFRAETPDGSLPAFAEDHVASRLNPYPPHYKAAFACSILLYPPSYRLTLRLAFPSGRTTGLPRSASVPARVRSGFYAGGAPSATGDA